MGDRYEEYAAGNDVAMLAVGRSLALLGAWLWAFFPGFGLIDLATAVPPGDPDFRTHWFLEGSWGLFITVLVAAPLLAAALRPARAATVAVQLLAVGGCGVIAALLAGDSSFLSFPLGMATSAALVWLPLRKPPTASSRSRRRGWIWPTLAIGAFVVLPVLLLQKIGVIDVLVGTGFLLLTGVLAFVPVPAPPAAGRRPMSWPLLGVVALTALPWVIYAFSVAGDHRDGLRYEGFGVDRITAQAALPLAMVVLPCAAALGWPSSRIPVWTAALAGGGFGVLAILYPDHLASPGATWGGAAIAWAALTLVAFEVISGRSFRKGV